MNIAIIVGHSILKNGTCTSAKGEVLEYAYCKELAPIVQKYLKFKGHQVDVIICPEREFTKPSQEKTYKLGKINGKGYDLVVELHLNAYNGTAKDKLDDIFTDRGIKKRTDLYILTQTEPVSILIECFFCDSKEDYQRGDEAHEKDLIARKIAEGILNQELYSLFNLESEGFKNGSYIGRRAKVTANVLNVRFDRGTQYNVIGKLNKGDIVKLNYCLNGWVSIEGYKGNKGLGYISTDYLELI